MKPRHRAAIEMLLSHSDTEVAKALGVRLATLRAWMEMEGFSEALRAREREQESGARRIARQAVVLSASRICQMASDAKTSEPKVLLDVLKASGVFEAEAEDPGAALAEMVKIARRRTEARHAGSE